MIFNYNKNDRLMTTVRVKFRPSKVLGYEGSVFYQVTHRRRTLQISTGIRLCPDDWDAVEGRVVGSGVRILLVRSKVEGDLCNIRRVAADLEHRCGAYSVEDVVLMYRCSSAHLSFLAYIKSRVEALRLSGRDGTAANYERALKSFKAFLCGVDISVASVTADVIEAYEVYLAGRGIMRNSVSFYMRNLRSVYNKAVREGLASQTLPFQYVYTGVDRTRKKAVTENVVVDLYKMTLPCGDQRLALARDMFVFSFCARGMAFVDMAFLKRSDVCGEYICYARKKTGQQLKVKVDSHIKDIINRYSCRGSKYVFPIITAESTSGAYHEYRKALNEYNRQLSRLATRMQGVGKLSSYTARHSWATIARDHDVPISVISAGLGHSSEQTTRIYLAALDNSVIDDANEGILAALDR